MNVIGLLGRISSGKTTFLASVYKSLLEPVLLKNHLFVLFRTSNDQYLDVQLKYLMDHEFPPPTTGYNMQQFMISSQEGESRNITFSTLDISGKDLDDLVDNLSSIEKDALKNPDTINDEKLRGLLKSFEQFRGIVLFVDPGISSLKEAWKQDLLLWRLMHLSRVYHEKRVGKSLKLPIAVVMSKLDRFKLTGKASSYESEEVKKWCSDISGIPRTVSFLEENSPNHLYFGVSSTNKTKFKKKREYPIDFSPVNVLQPVVWLLDSMV
ncbi:MAG: hypothetical protein ACFFD4_39420 [Candidatus Odinarchaeota archaeon]